MLERQRSALLRRQRFQSQAGSDHTRERRDPAALTTTALFSTSPLVTRTHPVLPFSTGPGPEALAGCDLNDETRVRGDREIIYRGFRLAVVRPNHTASESWVGLPNSVIRRSVGADALRLTVVKTVEGEIHISTA